jgi:hypothetical protein
MKGNPARTDDFLIGRINLSSNDLGSDSDNDWTDGAIGDAHVYAGYTYDYYFKRFGRKGLNNADIRMQNLVHPVKRSDVQALFNQYPDYFVNAFYDGGGVMVFGEGLPPNFTLEGQTIDFFSGALDIVAHELSHGVTEYTSNLIYRNESGALNEAFSDIMGTSVEFFFQPPGNGPLKADYLMGEDVIWPGGTRSAENPGINGDPDHYSSDFSGARTTAAFTPTPPSRRTRLSGHRGRHQPDIGPERAGDRRRNREQMEKVFYRAFTQLMPANSTSPSRAQRPSRPLAISTETTAQPSAPSRRPGRPWGSTDAGPFARRDDIRGPCDARGPGNGPVPWNRHTTEQRAHQRQRGRPAGGKRCVRPLQLQQEPGDRDGRRQVSDEARGPFRCRGQLPRVEEPGPRRSILASDGSGTAEVTASVPHPFFFNQPRTVTERGRRAARRKRNHLQVQYRACLGLGAYRDWRWSIMVERRARARPTSP